MLELRHISKTFYPGTVHEKTALQDLSLTLQTGDFVTAATAPARARSSTPLPGALPLTADASCSTDRS